MTGRVYVDTPDGPEIAPAGAAVLVDLLSALEERLIRVGVPVQNWLNTGLSEHAVRVRLAEVGLTAPDEVVAWFGWHNGRNLAAGPASRLALPRFDMQSLEAAIDSYRLFGFDSAEPLPSFGAGTGWLRLVDDNLGCAVECLEPGPRPPRLRYRTEEFGVPGTERLWKARSICTLVGWMIDGIESGAHTWIDENHGWRLSPSLLPETQRAVGFV
ncbi:hypothetical protein [Leifsonia sp. RAF41]|uniref:hypothetical protein n=1 Tax=Leifsonia sp. RAF41 TaxID=3233056 RepID=UPI003F94E8E9